MSRFQDPIAKSVNDTEDGPPEETPDGTMEAPRLARLALALQRRLDHLPDNIDPSWNATLGIEAWGAARLPFGEARRRVSSRLFRHWCGPLPVLTELLSPAGGLALLARRKLLPRLCGLALLRRPGVLRCCLELRSRQRFQRALGPAFSPLLEMSESGAPLPGDAAHWRPVHWAWVGYADLVRAQLWPSPSLRRLVRLALPVHHRTSARIERAASSGKAVLPCLMGLDQLFAGEAPW